MATFELVEERAAVLSWLQAVDAPARGGVSDGVASQRRAMAALDGFEPLGGARFRSWLMPGSWPLFDDLDARLKSRLEQAFADNAVAALTEAARAQASQLTGVARDAVTGSLIENGQCTLPAQWQERVAAAPPAGRNLK